jgi:hypothetical protein
MGALRAGGVRNRGGGTLFYMIPSGCSIRLNEMEIDKSWLIRPLYYKRDATPYLDREPMLAWAEDMCDEDYRRVGYDELKNGITISTVWLGIDHGFGLASKPLIFESIVFFPDKAGRGPSGIKCLGSNYSMVRYHTEAQAERGHAALVKKYSTLKSIEQILKRSKDEEKPHTP